MRTLLLALLASATALAGCSGDDRPADVANPAGEPLPGTLPATGAAGNATAALPDPVTAACTARSSSFVAASRSGRCVLGEMDLGGMAAYSHARIEVAWTDALPTMTYVHVGLESDGCQSHVTDDCTHAQADGSTSPIVLDVAPDAWQRAAGDNPFVDIDTGLVADQDFTVTVTLHHGELPSA